MFHDGQSLSFTRIQGITDSITCVALPPSQMWVLREASGLASERYRHLTNKIHTISTRSVLSTVDLKNVELAE